MGRYFLGIDNGNTVSKAALFDVRGKEIAIASCKVDTEYPHPGWTERDMEMLWDSTACAIHDVLSSSGVSPRRNCRHRQHRTRQRHVFTGQARTSAPKWDPIHGHASRRRNYGMESA